MTFTSTFLTAVGAKPGWGASDEALDAAQEQLGITFPAYYREVMLQTDGGEADFGASWLVLNSLESMLDRNLDKDLMQYFPGLTFLGSDGGGEAYARDWRARPGSLYLVTPFSGNFEEDSIPGGNTFEEFLSILHRGIRFGRVGSETTSCGEP